MMVIMVMMMVMVVVMAPSTHTFSCFDGFFQHNKSRGSDVIVPALYMSGKGRGGGEATHGVDAYRKGIEKVAVTCIINVKKSIIT